MKINLTNKIFFKIEFWIIFIFLLRLYGISNPPLETAHNWRQVTGLMVVRNFLEENSNILYPRIDDTQGDTGIIGMEFPVMNYICFIISKIFGYTDWYGRLINLIVSSIGIYFFYKIIKEHFNHKIAFYSSLSLIFSIWFVFSRKMMPDTFSISLVFIGLYYGLRFLKRYFITDIFLYILFFSLGILAKIPAGMYLVIFAIPFFSKNIKFKYKIVFSFSTLIPLSLTYLWYFVWNPYLSAKYGVWYNSGNDFFIGFSELSGNLDLILKKFYFESFYSFVFFALALIGIGFAIIKSNYKILVVFALLSFIFVLYIIKSGHYFYEQNYYIIPYVPILALLIGYTFSFINKKWLISILLICGISECIINQYQDFTIKQSELYKLNLEAIADSVTNKTDLIVINGNDNPQQLYLSHRKGWICTDKNIDDTAYIKGIAKKGCDYIFVNKNTFNKKYNGTPIYDDANFQIFKIDIMENN